MSQRRRAEEESGKDVTEIGPISSRPATGFDNFAFGDDRVEVTSATDETSNCSLNNRISSREAVDFDSSIRLDNEGVLTVDHGCGEGELDQNGQDNRKTLPYPGFVPVAFRCLSQTSQPRSLFLRIITNPYPFFKSI